MRVALGDDPELIQRLRSHLKGIGAKAIDQTSDPWDAEFTTVSLLIDRQVLTVDVDNWMGVSLDGPDNLVQSIPQHSFRTPRQLLPRQSL